MTRDTDVDVEAQQAAGRPPDSVEGPVEGPVEAAIDQPEPWERWETKLCLWSVGVGIVGLVVLGLLVNAFIL